MEKSASTLRDERRARFKIRAKPEYSGNNLITWSRSVGIDRFDLFGF